MSSKRLIWFGVIVGSTLGSYIPLLWGAGFFSFSSITFGALGGMLGIWLGFKISQ